MSVCHNLFPTTHIPLERLIIKPTWPVCFPLVNWWGPPTSVCARLLGYLIIYSPTAVGRTVVTNEINSCNNDEEKLHKLAQFYINHFLRAVSSCLLIDSDWDHHLIDRTVRQNKGQTPVPSGHVSRPSFDDMQETMKHLLVEPPKDHTGAKNGVSPVFLEQFYCFSQKLLGPCTGWLSLCNYRGCRLCISQTVPQRTCSIEHCSRCSQD